MLLLPIAALAVMAFFAVLLMMSVANACEQRQRKRQPCQPLFAGVTPFTLSENGRLLWGTQVPALQYLESRASCGVPPAALRPWYRAMVRHYPALYEGHSFQEWIDFLSEARIVMVREERVLLAPHGHSVLDQCRASCGHDFSWPQ